ALQPCVRTLLPRGRSGRRPMLQAIPADVVDRQGFDPVLAATCTLPVIGVDGLGLPSATLSPPDTPLFLRVRGKAIPLLSEDAFLVVPVPRATLGRLAGR